MPSPIFSERSFIRDDNGLLVAEASDLGLAPGTAPRTLRVACTNGSTAYFAFIRFDRNRGDIAGWRYIRTSEAGGSLRWLLIIND